MGHFKPGPQSCEAHHLLCSVGFDDSAEFVELLRAIDIQFDEAGGVKLEEGTITMEALDIGMTEHFVKTWIHFVLPQV